MYDCIVVGLGPAGIAAAIYLKRANKNILCLEKNMLGGILNYIDKVDNYPGLPNISGTEFSYKLCEHLDYLNIPYSLEGVTKVEKQNNYFNIYTKKNTYKAKYVIIASGRTSKKLNLENEDKFLGRGISYCAICDGAFFKNKDVAVVGGGDAACSEALYLSNFVNKLYLLVRKDKLKATSSIKEKLENKENITILYDTEIQSINGDTSLESITLNNGNILKVEGLFIYIGYYPNINYLNNFDIFDKEGYINVNKNYETNIDNLYAIGDNVSKEHYQIILAMSEGVKAALDIVNKLDNYDIN